MFRFLSAGDSGDGALDTGRRRVLRTTAVGGLTVSTGALLPGLVPGRALAADDYEARLEELGITLPEVPPPVANYVP